MQQLREIVERLLHQGQHEHPNPQDVDLNKVSEDELRRSKEAMNVSYESNRVGTSSADFEYDKRIEFQPTQENEWDNDTEEEEEEEEIVFSNADDSDDIEF